MTARSDETRQVLAETRYLRLVSERGWSYVERPGVTGVVVVVAVTDARRLLLVEQVRPPVRGAVVELPAGLVGDEAAHAHESLADAARRELLEETGYTAERVEPLLACPTSPGMTDERASFFLASGLRKIAAGGGVGEENITVHEVPLDELPGWLRARDAAGIAVAAKVLTGILLYQWHAAGFPARITGT